jgi:enamine deaminase RidA (YjgF/YER057c/UK114 family)
LGKIDDRLAGLALELPKPPAAPPGVVLPFKWVRVSGGYAYASGHGPLDGGDVLVRGKVGADVSPERGYEAARLTALSMLASLKLELRDLDRITGWVKLLGLVNCAPGFSGTPGVINGFSDLVMELWEDDGRHARSAIGAAELPFEMSVEVEAILEVS